MVRNTGDPRRFNSVLDVVSEGVPVSVQFRAAQYRGGIDMKKRYFIKIKGFGEKEVDQETYVQFEQEAGFYPKPGCGPEATGGFSSGSVSGRIKE